MKSVTDYLRSTNGIFVNNNSKLFQPRYLRNSILFAIANVVFFGCLAFYTNLWGIVLLLFSVFTFLTSGITWLIHFQYLKNDKKWQPFFTPEGFFVRNESKGRPIKITGDIKNAFYYKRTALEKPETGRVPSFTNYYYVEIITLNNEVVYLSCFLVEKFEIATFIHLDYIQKNFPFIRK